MSSDSGDRFCFFVTCMENRVGFLWCFWYVVVLLAVLVVVLVCGAAVHGSVGGSSGGSGVW